MEDDLVTWLRVQLNEDERVARRPAPAPWSLIGEPSETRIVSHAGVTVAVGWLRDLEHVARHDPARVLAEVEAKRRILSNWQEANREAPKTRWQGWHPDEALCQARRLAYESVIRLLALPYADRPGYLEAWRP